MKTSTLSCILSLLITAAPFYNSVFGQSVLNPVDPVITYDSTHPPVQPTWGSIGKWVRTKVLSWNTDAYKCYIYKGSRFRLLFPKSYNPTAADGKKYPMMIFYHGNGEGSTNIYDNEYQLYHGGDVFLNAENKGTFDGYVIALQTQGGWGPNEYGILKELIDYMAINNKLDIFHITGNGLSGGGGGTWGMFLANPTYNAAILPMSAVDVGFAGSSTVNECLYEPIWNAHGGLDGSPAPSTAAVVNNAMLAAGAHYFDRVYPTEGHDVWDSTWLEPDFWPFMNRAYAANPWPLTGRTKFCPGDAINVTMGLVAGFAAYQWRKDGVVISGATSNTIKATATGTYDARVQRGSTWSDWSHTPVVVSVQAPTVTPPITVSGLMSPVIPAPDNAGVTLQVPAGYVSYVWQKVGSTTTIGTSNTLSVTTPGSYKVEVTEQFGCSSNFSTPFNVVDANGPNKPDPATNVLVSAVNNTSLRLDWSQNPTPVNNETNFEIYMGVQPGGPYKLAAIAGRDVAKDTIGGLNAGTKYYFTIRAVNGTGAAALSNEASGSTIADVQPPTAPGNVVVTGTTRSSVSMSWTASTDDVGVTGYIIYVNGQKSYVIPATQQKYTVYGLQYAATYNLTIRATDQAGNLSPASAQVTSQARANGLGYKAYVFSPVPSTLPNFGAMSPVDVGNMPNISLAGAPQATNYAFLWEGYITIPTTGVYTFQTASDDGSKVWLGPLNGQVSPYSYSGAATVSNEGLHSVTTVSSANLSLSAGVYPIAIAYYQGAGSATMALSWKTPASGGSFAAIPNSAFIESSVAAGQTPAAPSNLAATALAYNKIGLTWKDNSNNETGFELVRSTNGVTGFNIIATVGSGVSSYTDTTVAASTNYFYQVRAVNQFGQSLYSRNYAEAYWTFNNNYTDVSGNGHVLTALGSPVFSTDRQEGDYSVQLNGSNQSIDISPAGGFTQESYSQRTVALWMKSISNIANRIVFDIGGSDNGLALVLNNNTLIAAVASGNVRSTISTPYTSLDWNHVAVVYNGDSLLLYVNGALAASATSLPFHSIGTTIDRGRIGQSYSTNAYNTTGALLAGLVDAFGIYNMALAPEVVTALKNQTYIPSNASTAGLPAVPSAPGGLSAVAVNTVSVKLSWADNSSNESNFEVYRSNGNNQNYVRIGSLPANTTSYVDGGLFANAMYYYKVRAVDPGGPSAYSAEVSATTKDSVPVITEVGNLSVRYGTTTTVNVSARSVNSGALVFTAAGLPSFASFVDHGNGSGTLTFNPTSANQGNYTGISVVVADAFGGKDTTKFNVSVNNNFTPVIDTIANYTMSENDTLSIPISATENNTANALTISATNVPGPLKLVVSGNGKANLVVHPGFANAGSYAVVVRVDDANGLFATRAFTLLVKDKAPTPSVYLRFLFQDAVGAPWNSISGTTTTGLTDNNGVKTKMGLTISPSWFAGLNAGPTTGNNSGVYPDAVLKDFYYFGGTGAPDSITATLTGLDTAQVYNLTFLSSSVLNWQTDNGTTRFRVGGQQVSLAVQNNTQRTVTISNVKALTNGSLPVVVSKAPGSSYGFWNAMVVTPQYDDGSVPAAPTGLTAQNAAGQVQLSWNSGAYNATGFEIWRAPVSSGVYGLIGTASGNDSRSYTDGALSSNTGYNYKIRAVNVHGASAYTDIVNITTTKVPPRINVINDVVMKNNVVQTIPVTTGNTGVSPLKLTADHLPAFVTLTDNGDGTGTLNISPTAGTTGVFPGLTVTVTDAQGLSASDTFSVVVTEPAMSSVYVNFSDGSTRPPRPWNTMVGPPSPGLTLSNLVDDSNTPTGMSVKLVNGFNWTSATGMRPRNGTTVYPESVTRNSFYEPSTTVRQIQVSGLSAANLYNFVFFNSYQDGQGALTTYSIGSTTVSLQASFNTNKTVQINGVSPDASGNVTISVAKGAGATNAYINALVIQGYNAAASPLPAPAGLRITNISKTSLSLQWQDRSSNETGFEIWRSAGGAGYALLTTVAPNTTSYENRSITPDATYYYIVRAVRSGTYSGYSNVAVATTYAYQVYLNFTATSQAPLPWNNLNAPPQVGFVWSNFDDSAGSPTSVGMTVTKPFAGVQSLGNVTNNNSGIYPDLVLKDDYILFPGQVGGLKLQGLNLAQKYDLTFLPSTTTGGDNTTAYVTGRDTVLLSGTLNSTATVTMYGKTADNNGELGLDVLPYTTSSQAGLINAWVVQGYTPYSGGVPAVPASTMGSSSERLVTSVAAPQLSGGDSVLRAYPNPFRDQFTLSVPAENHDKVLVGIYDQAGRLIYSKSFENLVQGSNFLSVQPVQHLSTGIYFVRVVYGNGKGSKIFKMFKQ